jgi:hypothetical protein
VTVQERVVADPWEYVRSVEWVLLIWVGSAVVLCAFTVRGLRAFRWSDLRAVKEGEEGAAYIVSYAMAMPIYVFLCFLILETTLILSAKLGSVYAVYAAARNNIVYRSLDPNERGSSPPRAKLAAVRAMAPYGSTNPKHRTFLAAPGTPYALEYALAAKRFTPEITYTQTAIVNGFLYAYQATSVRVSKEGTGPNDPVEVVVTYRVPLRMPIASRILGRRDPLGGFYATDVKSKVRLPDESPVNMELQERLTPGMPLGIKYEPPR